MYDVILLGATFLSAGIAQISGEKSLIIDSRPQAGYEFIGAFNFGCDYDKNLNSEEAKNLQKIFEERNYKTENRICLFDCTAPFYKLLRNKNVLLNTQIISIEKCDDYFVCTTCGVSGLRTFEAKKIIDTRSNDDNCISKTYNILMDGNASELDDYEAWGFENNYVLRIKIPNAASYPDARARVKNILENLPENHKLVMSADCFDYEMKTDYPTTKNSIAYLPSKAFANPLLAFDKGVTYAKELCNATF